MSIFGKFYGRIHGSVEFLASESLNYILNSSKKVNENLIGLINLNNNSNYSNISFLSQVQGDNAEIPDLSGYDKNGKEVIILETKFWASLTVNQPVTYLNRLSENGILIFICPDLRKLSLKGEIISVLEKEKIEYNDSDEKLIRIGNKNIIIYSWDTILNTLKNDIDNSEFDVLSDINQLKGLCEKIDSDSFLPITNEDLSPSIPRKIFSYYRIIDKVIDKLSNEIGLSTKGLKTTPQQWGYTRYAFAENLTIRLDANLEFWSKHADTPIWIQISEEWKATPTIAKMSHEIEKQYNLKNYADQNERPYYPIRLTMGEIEEKVIESISDFINNIYNIYKKCS